ncbi:MAG: hypothetical protein FWF24_06190 [Alphaproteobacteria bacterium]|nr:hypothetical protein [Alphaproteobacteria bacterium]
MTKATEKKEPPPTCNIKLPTLGCWWTFAMKMDDQKVTNFESYQTRFSKKEDIKFFEVVQNLSDQGPMWRYAAMGHITSKHGTGYFRKNPDMVEKALNAIKALTKKADTVFTPAYDPKYPDDKNEKRANHLMALWGRKLFAEVKKESGSKEMIEPLPELSQKQIEKVHKSLMELSKR